MRAIGFPFGQVPPPYALPRMRAVVAAGLAVIFLAGCSGAPGGVTVTTTLGGSASTARHRPPPRRRLRHLRQTTPTSPAASSTRGFLHHAPRSAAPARREVEVKRGPRTALYTLPADLLFDSGEAVLRPSSLVVVDDVAGTSLNDSPADPSSSAATPTRWAVLGRTESFRDAGRRRWRDPPRPGRDRADRDRGFGELAPRAPTRPREGRAQNRRVEILVRTRR